MAMADPQSVTINSVAVSLPRIPAGENKGVFKSNDGNATLTVSHTYGKRPRSVVRLDHQKVAPDPLISSTNILYGMGVYLVADRPQTGYTVAEQKQIVDALIALLTASSGVFVTRFLGGEA